MQKTQQRTLRSQTGERDKDKDSGSWDNSMEPSLSCTAALVCRVTEHLHWRPVEQLACPAYFVFSCVVSSAKAITTVLHTPMLSFTFRTSSILTTVLHGSKRKNCLESLHSELPLWFKFPLKVNKSEIKTRDMGGLIVLRLAAQWQSMLGSKGM